jgi:hypothetical protein
MATRTNHVGLYENLVSRPEWNVLSNDEMERLKKLVSGNS